MTAGAPSHTVEYPRSVATDAVREGGSGPPTYVSTIRERRPDKAREKGGILSLSPLVTSCATARELSIGVSDAIPPNFALNSDADGERLKHRWAVHSPLPDGVGRNRTGELYREGGAAAVTTP